MRKFDELSKAEKIVIIQHAQKYYETHTDRVLSLMRNSSAYEEPAISIRLRPDKWSDWHWSWYAKQSERIPEIFTIAENSIPYYQLNSGVSNEAIVFTALIAVGIAIIVAWFV